MVTKSLKPNTRKIRGLLEATTLPGRETRDERTALAGFETLANHVAVWLVKQNICLLSHAGFSLFVLFVLRHQALRQLPRVPQLPPAPHPAHKVRHQLQRIRLPAEL